MDFNQPVEVLSGVGRQVASRLARLNIRTIGDLVKHYPRRWEDYSKIVPINRVSPGLVSVKGQIHTMAMRRAHRRPGLTITEAIISDQSGTLKAIWFNQPYLKAQFLAGTEVVLSGKLEFRNNDLALRSPAIEKLDRELTNAGRIISIYPETDKLSSKQIRQLIYPLLTWLQTLPETLPAEVVEKAKLISHAEAISHIHFPGSLKKLAAAKRRIAFEELFMLALASMSIRREVNEESAPAIEFDQNLAKRFTGLLPYTLTDDQRVAAWEILQDMKKDVPMNRLLEGDVGSGKTVVALLAAATVAASGHQTVLMVPTEVLARQHYIWAQPIMEALGVSTHLIIGSHKASQKRAVHSASASGEAGLIIGTQALLSSKMDFSRLGLVVIDEQHRFGVNQRIALKRKAGYLPHLLSMTATPIPRSLALTIYGDLDLSILAKQPSGRLPVLTKVISEVERADMYRLIDEQIKAGQQAFVVCPTIYESDKLTAASVDEEAKKLSAGPLGRHAIGLLHGKMKPEEKEEAMAKFVAGDIKILVCTSVIEVGVDVPQATVMLVEGAERFGLAALHQLRGRVGRSDKQSFCFLAASSGEGNVERLAALERTQDGFRLAQIDLEIRGPGQIYGWRQHGLLDLKMADISDTKLVAQARSLAQEFLQSESSLLKYPLVNSRINQLKTLITLD